MTSSPSHKRYRRRLIPHIELASRCGLFAVTALLCTGCVISPQPEPPSMDTSRVTVTYSLENPEDPLSSMINIVGAPEAVSPGEINLSVINLDQRTARADVRVGSDGGFATTISGSPGNRLRFELVDASQRSETIYVRAPEIEGPVDEVFDEFDECVELNPPDVLDFGEVQLGDIAALELDISNDCELELMIADTWLAFGEMNLVECALLGEECHAGLSPETEHCTIDRERCDLDCLDLYQACLDDGIPLEECLDQRIDCVIGCGALENECREMACEPLIEECYQRLRGPWDGFDVNLAMLPLMVRPGGARTIVITFAPVMLGLAEEILVLDTFALVGGSIEIRITGFGIE